MECVGGAVGDERGEVSVGSFGGAAWWQKAESGGDAMNVGVDWEGVAAESECEEDVDGFRADAGECCESCAYLVVGHVVECAQG